MKRAALSRPLQLALDTNILTPDSTLLDYGCGHGQDLRRLTRRGMQAWGWDPVHRPDGRRDAADVVNLGYVINVIEDPRERLDVLQRAWRLAKHSLVLSVRLTTELRGQRSPRPHGDGYVTSKGTFQRFYRQAEIRSWTEDLLGTECVALAPGVLVAFKEPAHRHGFLASRYHRRAAAPRVRRNEQLFEQHREMLRQLMDFYASRGRIPVAGEISSGEKIVSAFGSFRRAFAVIRRATDEADWDRIREERREDLRVFFALDRFGGRPKVSDLPDELQLDVKDFFGVYTRACKSADELLFQAGDPAALACAARSSPVGKLVGEALYLHETATVELPPLLRVYEGCARAFIGEVDTANVTKLDLRKPRASYLEYENFERDPHPALVRSTIVYLDRLEVSSRDYYESTNRPILHRKELLVDASHPSREKFARLTAQETRYGLLDDPSTIGRQEGWEKRVSASGMRLRGHRLVRA